MVAVGAELGGSGWWWDLEQEGVDDVTAGSGAEEMEGVAGDEGESGGGGRGKDSGVGGDDNLYGVDAIGSGDGAGLDLDFVAGVEVFEAAEEGVAMACDADVAGLAGKGCAKDVSYAETEGGGGGAFEDRNFAILAPLAELQAQEEGTADPEEGLSLEIFEVKDDMFTPLDDEALAERLMKHLDEQEAKLKAEEEKD